MSQRSLESLLHIFGDRYDVLQVGNTRYGYAAESYRLQ